jgi:hypothetical protein
MMQHPGVIGMIIGAAVASRTAISAVALKQN